MAFGLRLELSLTKITLAAAGTIHQTPELSLALVLTSIGYVALQTIVL